MARPAGAEALSGLPSMPPPAQRGRRIELMVGDEDQEASNEVRRLSPFQGPDPKPAPDEHGSSAFDRPCHRIDQDVK